jgi:hypothetical protein
MKAQRVEHLHFKMIVGSIKIVAQMLNPYKFVFIGLGLNPTNNFV